MIKGSKAERGTRRLEAQELQMTMGAGKGNDRREGHLYKAAKRRKFVLHVHCERKRQKAMTECATDLSKEPPRARWSKQREVAPWGSEGLHHRAPQTGPYPEVKGAGTGGPNPAGRGPSGRYKDEED